MPAKLVRVPRHETQQHVRAADVLIFRGAVVVYAIGQRAAHLVDDYAVDKLAPGVWRIRHHETVAVDAVRWDGLQERIPARAFGQDDTHVAVADNVRHPEAMKCRHRVQHPPHVAEVVVVVHPHFSLFTPRHVLARELRGHVARNDLRLLVDSSSHKGGVGVQPTPQRHQRLTADAWEQRGGVAIVTRVGCALL